MDENEIIKNIILRRRLLILSLFLKYKEQREHKESLHQIREKIKKPKKLIANLTSLTPRIYRPPPVTEVHKLRPQQEDAEKVIQDMRELDEYTFFETTRLTVEQFDYLLSVLNDKLSKCGKFRSPVTAGIRLALTLRFLTTGDSLTPLSSAFNVGKSTACIIIRETCEAFWEVLFPMYLNFPSQVEWKNISEEFKQKFNLPNCVGAIDCKHCVIQAPHKSASENFNIVMFATCDTNHLFTYVDIGSYDPAHDGSVLKESSFGYKLFHNHLDLPPDDELPNSKITFPYFFIGNEQFPLTKNLLKPYNEKIIDRDKKNYNDRLHNGRRCIENTFGIMIARFKIFHKIINALPETTESILKGAVCLHNFIMKSELSMPIEEQQYCPPGYADVYDNRTNKWIAGDWRNEQLYKNPALQDVRQLNRRVGTRNPNRTSAGVRDMYNQYMNNNTEVVYIKEEVISD